MDAPVFDGFTGMSDRPKPMLIQAFIAAPTVKTLHEGVLDGFARLNEAQLDAAAL